MHRDRTSSEGEAPPWVAPFLAGLIVTGSVRQALAEAGIDFDTAWKLYEAEEDFAYYWDRAMRAHRLLKTGIPYWEAVSDEAAMVN